MIGFETRGSVWHHWRQACVNVCVWKWALRAARSERWMWATQMMTGCSFCMNSAFITALKGEILLREQDNSSTFQIRFFFFFLPLWQCERGHSVSWCPQSALRATTAKNLSGLEKKIYERIVYISEGVWFLSGGPFISVHPLDLWEASACECENWSRAVCESRICGSAPVCDALSYFSL